MSDKEMVTAEQRLYRLLLDAQQFVSKSRCSAGHSVGEVQDRARPEHLGHCIYCKHQFELYEQLGREVSLQEMGDTAASPPPAPPDGYYTFGQISYALNRSLYAKTGQLAIDGIIEDLHAALKNGGNHPMRSTVEKLAFDELPEGAVSVLKPQGTEETGNDRPAAPLSHQNECPTCHARLRVSYPWDGALDKQVEQKRCGNCGWLGPRRAIEASDRHPDGRRKGKSPLSADNLAARIAGAPHETGGSR